MRSWGLTHSHTHTCCPLLSHPRHLLSPSMPPPPTEGEARVSLRPFLLEWGDPFSSEQANIGEEKKGRREGGPSSSPFPVASRGGEGELCSSGSSRMWMASPPPPSVSGASSPLPISSEAHPIVVSISLPRPFSVSPSGRGHTRLSPFCVGEKDATDGGGEAQPGSKESVPSQQGEEESVDV